MTLVYPRKWCRFGLKGQRSRLWLGLEYSNLSWVRTPWVWSSYCIIIIVVVVVVIYSSIIIQFCVLRRQHHSIFHRRVLLLSAYVSFASPPRALWSLLTIASTSLSLSIFKRRLKTFATFASFVPLPFTLVSSLLLNLLNGFFIAVCDTFFFSTSRSPSNSLIRCSFVIFFFPALILTSSHSSFCFDSFFVVNPKNFHYLMWKI